MPRPVQVLVAIGLVAYSLVSIYGRINPKFGARVFSRIPADRIRRDSVHIVRYTIIPVLVTVGYLGVLVVAGRTAVPSPAISGPNPELQYAEACGQVLGDFLAAKRPGVRVAIIAPEWLIQGMGSAVIEGLRKGLANGGSVVEIIPLKTREDSVPVFTAAEFDATIAERRGRMDVLVSLVGLPPDCASMNYWRLPADEVPALALAGDSPVWGLLGVFTTGKVMAATVCSPRAVYDEEPGPDPATAFAKRYLLVTPESAGAIHQAYPSIFGQDNPSF